MHLATVRRWLQVFGLFLCPAALAAQQSVQSVTGLVRDTAGKPVATADVLLGDRRTVTGPSGTFRIDSLKPGQYSITIRLIGYRPVHSRVVVVASEPTEMEYFLIAAPFVLDPIVVESRRTGIYGAVGDTSYKAAVGARVKVAGFRGGEVLTDSMGRFAFPEADRGVYMVRVTYPGYSEHRFTVELKQGEGRELGILLIRADHTPSRRDEAAVEDLGHRLAIGSSSRLLTPKDLARSGSSGICDLPQLRSVSRGRDPKVTLILNGVTVLKEFDVGSLCSWRADEVELVEYSTEVCKDYTLSIAALLDIWCTGRTRQKIGNVGPTHGSGGAYVVIWEKR